MCPVSVDGYAEVSYQQQFVLETAALGVRGERGPIATRLVLQAGRMPALYYAGEAEPTTWQHVQTATIAAKLPRAWSIEAGLVPSPIGPEVFAIKDDMNWSRSNLFVALPFYHLGATVAHPLADGWSGKLHLYNGWNAIVDTNGTPSIAASASFTNTTTVAQLLYFGGNERPRGAVEGAPWRHLFDAYVQHAVSDRVTLLAHANMGFERSSLGTQTWQAGAAYVKVALASSLYAALRGDVVREDAPAGATPVLIPTSWIAAGTATLAYQEDGISLRVEYRHDVAVTTNDTVTAGITAWF